MRRYILGFVSPEWEAEQLQNAGRLARFEQTILPYMDAAYNLAGWLTRRDQDAEDVVQEAYLRAFQFFGSFHGGDGRTWLLAIVRNTCYTWLRKNRSPEQTVSFDEEQHGLTPAERGPEAHLVRTEDAEMLHDALRELPVDFREVLVLRELEELSYKEISHVIGVPIGTVMSRLARGRERLQQLLIERYKRE
jgi:RNA polymerase sigma-70 factor (ECF subfamily)